MNTSPSTPDVRPARTRLRIRFTKQGDLRWIGHKDLARVWERLLRRAGLRLAFTEGFHPKPKISFPSALALGIEALDELVELEIEGRFELDAVRRSIEGQLPDGMQLTAIESLEPGQGKAKVAGASYRVRLPADAVDAVARQVQSALANDSLEIQRNEKTIACPVGPGGLQAEIREGHLEFTLPHLPQGSIRPAEFLESLGLGELLAQGAVLQRTEVHLQSPPSREDHPS
ncbi:MAG: DUF2344 domain-containing protein [Planctomycetota bacterium]|nr:MAG: DUF2344 domain-containing protein [Planctomycetota bacterium]